jgi:tetratricopeptide (TPR) repeat protein
MAGLDLNAMLSGLPETAPKVLELARALEHRGHRDEAARLLKKASRAHEDVRFDRARGALFMRMAQWDKAVRVLQAAQLKDQHDPHTSMMLCESLIACHQLDQAQRLIDHIEQRFSTGPQVDNLRGLLARQRQALGQGTNPSLPTMSETEASMLKMSPFDSAVTKVPSGAHDATAAVSLPDGFLDAHKLDAPDDDSTRAIPSGAFRSLPPRPGVDQNTQATGRLSPDAASAALLNASGARVNNDPTEAFSAHRYRNPAAAAPADDATRAISAHQALSALSEVSGSLGQENTYADASAGALQDTFGSPDSVGDEATQADAGSGAFGFGVMRPKTNRTKALGQRSEPNDGFPDDVVVEDADDDIFDTGNQRKSKFDIPDPYASPDEPDEPISANLPPRSGRLMGLSNTGPSSRRPQTGPHPAPRAPARSIDTIAPPSLPEKEVARVDFDTLFDEMGRSEPDPMHTSGSYASVGESAPWREQVAAKRASEADVVQSQLQPSPWAPPEPELKADIPVFVPSSEGPAPHMIASPEQTHHGPPPEPEEPAEQPSAPSKPRKNTTLKLLVGLIVLLTLVLLGGYVALVASDSSLDDALRASLDASAKASASDTAAGYEEAVTILRDAIALPSAVGAPDDPLVPRDLPLVPGTGSQQTRSEVLARAAVLAALGEYRYHGAGGLDAATITDAASARLGEEHPSILTARAYLSLDNAPFEALKLVEKGRMTHPDDDLLVEAQLLALIRLERLEQVQSLSREIRNRGVSSVRQRHVVGDVLATLSRPDAETHLRALLKDAPEHAPTVVTLANLLTSRGQKDAQKAVVLLNEFEGEPNKAWKAHVDAARGRANGEDDTLLAALTIGSNLPGHTDLEIARVEEYIRIGDHESARKSAAKGDLAGTHSASLLLARIAMLTGDTKDLEATLADVPSAYPERYWIMGKSLLQDGDYSGAITSFEEAQGIDDYDGRSSALLTLARVHAAPHQRDAFLKAFDKIAARSGATPTLLESSSKARVHLARLSSKRKERKTLLAKAEKNLRVLIAKSSRPDLEFTLCEAMMLGGKLEAAANHCAIGLTLNPSSPYGTLLNARLWLLDGKTEEALTALAKLADRRPDDFDVSQWLVRALIVDASFDDAQKELDRWLGKPQGDSSTGQVLGGLIALNRGQSSAAATFFERGIQADPKNDEARILHAYASIRTGLPEDAVATVTATLRKRLTHPDWGGYAWLALGELRRRQGKFADAEENLGKALDLIQSGTTPAWMRTEIHLQRALAWQDHKGWNHPEVLKHLTAAREVSDPDYPALLYVEGLYNLERRKPDLTAAVARFTAALEADPNSCPTLDALATAHKKAKDRAAETLVRAQILKNCE